MKHLTLFLGLSMHLMVLSQLNVGSGNCLDFAANINNANHVNLGSLNWINTNDFTFECWMKVNSVFDDEAFFSNKDWSSGSNTGVVFDVQNNGSNMKFNFKVPGQSRKDLTVAVNVLNRDWFHFAGTMKRSGFFIVYINGVAKDSISISSYGNGSFASQYTYKLGQDGTGNYTWNGGNPRFNGKIDEVRIWSTVRTPQEIRANMCRTLTGAEANLYAYYPCNEASGQTLNDLTANNNDGTWINGINSNWKLSGAALGNESEFKYGAALTSDSVKISNANFGDLIVKNFNGITGIHVYRVQGSPTLSNGLNLLPGNTSYYGVYVVDTSQNATFEAFYRYSPYTAALNDENNLILFNRFKNDISFWANSNANQNLAANVLTKTSLKNRKEFLLGTITGQNCQGVDSLFLVSGNLNSATIGWQSNGTNWNIMWGPVGFSQAQATFITNTMVNPHVFSNLTAGVTYELYIQDTCANGSSIWTGPFTFSGQVCQAPTNLTATNITGSSATLTWTGVGGAQTYDIEWGLVGFAPGTGIPANGVSLPYTLTGLGPNINYAYYVRSNCGSGYLSSFTGPYAFSTVNNAGLIDINDQFGFSPNPFEHEIQILIPTEDILDVHLNALNGQALRFTQHMDQNKLTLNIENAMKGFYLIEVLTKSGYVTLKAQKL
jgi:hypothetical protein